MNQSNLFKQTAISLAILGGALFYSSAAMASAQFNPADNTVDIAAVDLPNGRTHINAETFSAKLRVIDTGNGNLELELMDAALISTPDAERSHFDAAFGQVYVPDVDIGGVKYNAVLELIPNSNPLRFLVKHFHQVAFTSCPAFAAPITEIQGACLLQGEINQDIRLTNDIRWIIDGGVFIGGDNASSATLSIEPDTRLSGRSGLDFLQVRRGSKIEAIGTPQHPIVMTGPREENPGEWGGLLLVGNAPVNGCSEGVAVCEQVNEAISTESFGGNVPEDNSGVLKYVSIRFAGFEVRPNEELNCLTLLGVGSGTTIDFVQCHRGLDDGFEMFGGTVNMTHMVSSGNGDDGFDLQTGWRGKAQFVLLAASSDDGDAGIEADNNGSNHDSLPRSLGQLANFTIIGSGTEIGGNGAVLRRGTAANIYNTVITDYPVSCLTIDNPATFENAGNIGNLSGQLTIENSYVNCSTALNDRDDMPFKASDWFASQAGNVVGDPQLNGFLPAFGSPLSSSDPLSSDDPFFVKANYIGAFADENDDWTKGGWTIGLE
ncbi:MAG: hypothetical protein RQ714_02125 [Nitrosomonas sp.]|nr:hypothetical protein [Nitrosomonas sp.]